MKITRDEIDQMLFAIERKAYERGKYQLALYLEEGQDELETLRVTIHTTIMKLQRENAFLKEQFVGMNNIVKNMTRVVELGEELRNLHELEKEVMNHDTTEKKPYAPPVVFDDDEDNFEETYEEDW